MNATQAENLRTLIRHMEGVDRTLNMNRMFYDDIAINHYCESPACALGEAAYTPALAYLNLPRTSGALHTDQHGALFVPVRETPRLFGLDLDNAWQRATVTPREWATEARKVLAEYGYSMDVQPDPFVAFMAKVREPVSLSDEIVTFSESKA